MSGFFGKLPQKADFVSRQLAPRSEQLISNWFEQGICEAREKLASTWIEKYKVSPIWHYYLSAGVIDEQPHIGVWIPSIDAIGRYFPLTILSPCNNLNQSYHEFIYFSPWLISAENLLITALDGQMSFDDFCQAVQELACPDHISDAENLFQCFEHEQPAIELSPVATVGNDLFVTGQAAHIEVGDQVGDQESRAIHRRLTVIETMLAKISDHLGIGMDGLNPSPINRAAEQHLMKTIHSQQDDQDPELFNIYYKIQQVMQPLAIDQDQPLGIWYSQGNDTISQQFIVTQGLPDSRHFHGFLTGFSI